MKKKWLGIRIVTGLCAVLGWWGLLYPELALTPDTVSVYAEEEDGEWGELTREWGFDDSLYQDLLSADRNQITFRSKLLKDLSLFWEALHDRGNAEEK